jgi:hypothetical protein
MTRESPESLNQRVDRVTKLLRVCGSVVLVVSASSFMAQRWQGQSDVVKYAFLLAQTVMAVMAGVLCATAIRESRAARTFLLLSVALVPMNYAVTSSFLYSRFALDGASKQLPQFASWIVPGPAIALAILALTLLVTLGATWVATTPLIRGNVGNYLIRLFAANALVLLPVRAPELAALVGLGSAALALSFELSHARHDSRLKTREARILRVILWVPSAIIVLRSGIFYETSAFLYAPFAIAIGSYLFVSGRRMQTASLRSVMELAGALLAASAWIPMGLELKARWFPQAPLHFEGALPLCIALVAFSRFAGPGKARLRTIAAVLALGICAFGLTLHPSLGTGLWAFLAAMVVCCYGMLLSSRALEVSGMVFGAAGLVCAVTMAVGLGGFLNWGGLSGLGALLVVAAAVLERRRGWVVARLMRATGLREELAPEDAPAASPVNAQHELALEGAS